MSEGRADRFDEMLDELYPEYSIAGITLTPSHILRECDPIAYRIALSEFEDWENENE
jgi:hypothetical protein